MPAGRDHDTSAGRREVGEELALLALHLGAERDVDLGRGAVGAVSSPAAPAATTSRGEHWTAAQGRQVAERGIGDQHHVPAPAAVATVGATLRHVLLAAEAERAVAPPAGADDDPDTVVEHAAARRARPGVGA